MARFNYVAEKTDGESYKGTAEARDRFELYQIIRREGGRVVSVTEESGSGIFSMSYWNMKLTRIKEYEKILFARNLGAMLSAGLPLARALIVIERQTKNVKLAQVVSDVGNDIRRGDPLHVALAKYPKTFPGLFVAMVRSGEEGGNVASSLQLVSDQMERIYDLKKKIKGALIYPCIILIAICGIATLMMIFVVPTLAATFAASGAKLPLSTRIVVGFSNFMVHYTFLAFGGFFTFLILLFVGLRTKPGKRISDFILIHMPIIGTLTREVNAARTARTLASLLASGVAVLTSLEITNDVVQNSYFRAVIQEAQKKVGAGEPLSATFAAREDLYPAFVGEMMAVGEETGQTNDMLQRLASYYEAEVDRKTKDMSTIIEPFLMLFIGAGVGFFAISMITPIYQLSQNIS